MGAQGCPTPDKKGHRTRALAERHMWSLFLKSKDPKRGLVRPYLCKCGLWHVGHMRVGRKVKR